MNKVDIPSRFENVIAGDMVRVMWVDDERKVQIASVELSAKSHSRIWFVHDGVAISVTDKQVLQVDRI